MLAPGLGLVLIGALGVHVEARVDLEAEVMDGLVTALARELQARTREVVVLDRGSTPSPCEAAECVDGLKRRLGADEVVLVGAFAGTKRLRIVARRAGGRESRRAERDVLLGRASWGAAVSELVLELFPGVVLGARSGEAGPPVDPSRSGPVAGVGQPAPDRLLPIIVLAGSAVLVGTGIAFGVSSAGAGRELETGRQTDAELRVLLDRRDDHRTAAVALAIGGAAVALVGVFFSSVL